MTPAERDAIRARIEQGDTDIYAEGPELVLRLLDEVERLEGELSSTMKEIDQ